MKIDPTNLDLLHDVIVPPPVPWWPPTAGWWIIIIGCAIALLGVSLKWFFRWQADRYRREALVLLGDGLEPAMISPLLKRVALTAWPRERTAALHGEAWLAFLDRSSGMNDFKNGPGAVLESVTYDSGSVADATELKRLAGEWIRKHRKELAP